MADTIYMYVVFIIFKKLSLTFEIRYIKSFVNFVLCRKEITTLQFENDSLERQLFSYQKSIAFAHSRGTYSDDLTLEDSRPEDDEQYFEGGDYSLGDRSLSTDTEYA